MTVAKDDQTVVLTKAADRIKRYARGYVKAETIRAAKIRNKKLAIVALTDAESLLAEADVKCAQARLEVLRLLQVLRRLAPWDLKWLNAKEAARINLYRTAAVGTKKQVVAAAKKLGAAASTLKRYYDERDAGRAAERALGTAYYALIESQEAREILIQSRNEMRKKVELAIEDCKAAYHWQQGLELHELEQDLLRAAAQFTKTESAQDPYDHYLCNMQELGVGPKRVEGPSALSPFTNDLQDWPEENIVPPRDE